MLLGRLPSVGGSWLWPSGATIGSVPLKLLLFTRIARLGLTASSTLIPFALVVASEEDSELALLDGVFAKRAMLENKKRLQRRSFLFMLPRVTILNSIRYDFSHDNLLFKACCDRQRGCQREYYPRHY